MSDLGHRLDAIRESGRVDVVIVGAGIYGATIAFEAASRGLKVALFEKNIPDTTNPG